MDPPVVPTSRNRLKRDYTEEYVAITTPTKPPRNEGQNTHQLLRENIESRADSRGSEGISVGTHTSRERSPPARDPSDLTLYDQTPERPVADRENMENLRKLDFRLDMIEEKSSYAPTDTSIGPASENTAISSSSNSRMTDFFSAEVFQAILHNPATSHRLLRFSQSRLCGENLEFLEKVDRYNARLNDLAQDMFEIHRDYISVNAPAQINISEAMLIKINKDLRKSLASTLPKLESVFIDSQSEIERLVASDIYPRFVRHQMTMSATKALAGDRGKYAGLGDCFVLTDPAKADNPIVYASDGFVKVTGYSRNEIIPRNCRFLQARQTDKHCVKRLREAIEQRQESVELLLNQKKNGEPFWNLLYTTPLFDSRGNVVFFLGGQINCSSSIHNSSDVLRVLSASYDTDEDAAKTVTLPETRKPESRTSKFFNSLRSPAKTIQPYQKPGMEDHVLQKMERLNLRKQIDTFYTAYSKFMVINHQTMLAAFYSAGISELLQPVRPEPGSTRIIGSDIFKFLSNHAPSKLTSEFKDRVRRSLKAGVAISLDIKLCTQKSMGFEKFASHWTPLKGAEGKVEWIVLTLGGFSD